MNQKLLPSNDGPFKHIEDRFLQYLFTSTYTSILFLVDSLVSLKVYYNLSVWKLKYEYNVFSLSHDTITVQPFSGIYSYMDSRQREIYLQYSHMTVRCIQMKVFEKTTRVGVSNSQTKKNTGTATDRCSREQSFDKKIYRCFQLFQHRRRAHIFATFSSG